MSVVNLTQDQITRCETVVAHRFQDKLLLVEALQIAPRVVAFDNHLHKMRKNADLALLGSLIAKTELCKKWYHSGQPRGKFDASLDLRQYRQLTATSAMGSCRADHHREQK